MTLEETAKFLKIRKSTLYKMAREGLSVSTCAVGTADRCSAQAGKISAVKIEFGRNNKVIIRIPYNQELIKKVKTVSGRKWN